MNAIKNKKGLTLVELIVVMAIMGIVGTVVSGLLRTGISALNRIREDMSYETEARIALSLVTIQIRQHDATGAIDVKSSTEIWLYDDMEHNTGTAITFIDGGLYSYRLSNGQVVESGERIADIFGFSLVEDVSETGLSISYNISIFYGNSGTKCLSQTVTQRSSP